MATPSGEHRGWHRPETRDRLEAVYDGVVRFTTDGTGISFYDVTPVARPSAYTQTYSTADKTHANPTAASVVTTGLVDAVTGNFAYDTAAQGDDVAVTINQIIVDVADIKQLVNSVIDDLQALGLLQ